jgi:uncharacterized membrane protein YkvA (DUF1232 family)
MPWWFWLVVVAGVSLGLWAGLVAVLLVAGRRDDARALAGFIPDCLVLLHRLLRDPRVSRRRKLLLLALLGYLALPFDLVPDFIPVVGQLDDVLVTALVLRAVVRGGGATIVRELWPGPERSVDVVLRLAGAGSSASSSL